MKITYDPANLEGAERYLSQAGVVKNSEDLRQWIEAKTIEQLEKHDLAGNPFVVLYRGIGFFWSIDQESTAPTFDVEIAESEADARNDYLNVTYWVTADAVQ